MSGTSAVGSSAQGASAKSASAKSAMGGIARRLLVAFIVLVVLGALSLLLPASIPGELPTSQMTQHGPGSCQICPPTEQLVAAAMTPGDNAWYVNVVLATAPFNTRLQLSFAGVPGMLTVQQTGTTWAAGAGAGTTLEAVNQSGNQVVLVLPDTLETNGFAVSTGSGDRIPANNYLQPTYPAAAHFNATDAVILLILAVTAWYGYKRGLMPETGDLMAILLSLLIAAVAFRPLSAWCTRLLPYPRVGAALVSCLLVLASGTAFYLILPRLMPRLATAAAPLGRTVDGSLGGLIACVRQLAVLAMLLTAGADLAVLGWASSNISSSLIGTALLHAWRTVYLGS